MGTILHMAWRSLWRSRRRTLISLMAISFAFGITLFLLAWNEGVYHQMIRDAVRMQAGHLTYQHPEYEHAPAVDLTIRGIDALRAEAMNVEGVLQTKALVLGQVVAKSGAGAVGVALMGIEPAAEVTTSPIVRSLVDGRYLEPNERRGVIVGAKLAERLDLEVGKKLVLSANDIHGQLVESLFRVRGIFRVGANELDGYLVQIELGAAQDFFAMQSDEATQLGLVLRDDGIRSKVAKRIGKDAGAEAVLLPWPEVLPELASYVRIDRGSNIVFQTILIFLSLLTIFNTLLMSALERTREFAVMLALGTPLRVLRQLLLTEGVLLGTLSCAVGLIFGLAITLPMQRWGLDFSQFVDGDFSVSGFMVDMRMRAKVTAPVVVTLTLGVLAATAVMSLVPMMRLGKIRVTDVLR